MGLVVWLILTVFVMWGGYVAALVLPASAVLGFLVGLGCGGFLAVAAAYVAGHRAAEPIRNERGSVRSVFFMFTTAVFVVLALLRFFYGNAVLT